MHYIWDSQLPTIGALLQAWQTQLIDWIVGGWLHSQLHHIWPIPQHSLPHSLQLWVPILLDEYCGCVYTIYGKLGSEASWNLHSHLYHTQPKVYSLCFVATRLVGWEHEADSLLHSHKELCSAQLCEYMCMINPVPRLSPRAVFLYCKQQGLETRLVYDATSENHHVCTNLVPRDPVQDWMVGEGLGMRLHHATTVWCFSLTHISLISRPPLPPEYVNSTSDQQLGAEDAWERGQHTNRYVHNYSFTIECTCHVWSF